MRVDPLSRARLAEGVVVERAHPARRGSTFSASRSGLRTTISVPSADQPHLSGWRERVLATRTSTREGYAGGWLYACGRSALEEVAVDHLPRGRDELARAVQRRPAHGRATPSRRRQDDLRLGVDPSIEPRTESRRRGVWKTMMRGAIACPTTPRDDLAELLYHGVTGTRGTRRSPTGKRI
eukprot:scaffold26406_cov63-Phaeocystis_antarctica.AAC.2